MITTLIEQVVVLYNGFVRYKIHLVCKSSVLDNTV